MKIKERVDEVEFEIGEEVGFAIKSGNDTGIVIGIKFNPNNVVYKVVWSDKSCIDHYGIELKKKA